MATDLSTVDAIALLAELVAAGSRGSAKSVTRCLDRLRLLRRWARLRAVYYPRFTEGQLFRRVCREAKAADPGLRISARTLRRWRDAYNGVDPKTGLAAGPAALLPRYGPPVRSRVTHTRSTAR